MANFFWSGNNTKKLDSPNSDVDYESSGFSDSLESEVSLLRTKNMELRYEIDEIKADIMKKKVTLYKIVDTRRHESVWKFLPAYRWHPGYFFEGRGAEFVQLYFWLIRDFGWSRRNFYMGMIAGGWALGWSIGLLLRAVYFRNFFESWQACTRFLWILALFTWMTGVLHDHSFQDTTKIAGARQYTCQQILTLALVLQGVCQFLIRPRADHNYKEATPYDEPRFRFATYKFRCLGLLKFEDWRDYENFQLFWWIGKDLAAATNNRGMWVIFYIPTILLNFYLINTSLNTRRVLVDHCHYLATFFWLFGTLIIQMGTMFLRNRWNHYSMFYPSDQKVIYTTQYFGGWAYIVAWAPLIILHTIWLAASEVRLIKDDAHEIAKLSEYGEEFEYEEDGEDIEPDEEQDDVHVNDLFEEPEKKSLNLVPLKDNKLIDISHHWEQENLATVQKGSHANATPVPVVDYSTSWNQSQQQQKSRAPV